MLTLTFTGNLCDKREAAKDFNSFATGVLSRHFGPEWVVVWDRQERGAWNAHVILDCLDDVTSGYDHDMAKLYGPTRSGANPALRRLRRILDDKYVAYGFGWKSRLEPIENGIGMFTYLAGKLSRRERVRAGKRARLVSYSKGFKRLFHHLEDAPPSHRQGQLRHFGAILEERLGRRPGGLSAVFGHDWRWRLMLFIREFREFSSGGDLLSRLDEYQPGWQPPVEVLGPDGEVYERPYAVSEFVELLAQQYGGHRTDDDPVHWRQACDP